MKSNQEEENIQIFFHDNENVNINNNVDIDEILKNKLNDISISSLSSLNNSLCFYNEDMKYKYQMVENYKKNTMKELFMICDFYEITKELKTYKYNKEQVILSLVEFELSSCNEELVSKRQTLWFYINELKNNKFMKKHIIW